MKKDDSTIIILLKLKTNFIIFNLFRNKEYKENKSYFIERYRK